MPGSRRQTWHSLGSFAFVTAEVSTRGYTTAFLLCPHPLQPKVEFPDGIFGTTWGFTGLFFPEEAADPASTGPQTHRRTAKPRRSPQIKFPRLGFLSYLFIQKKIYFPPSAGRWLDRQLCHWDMAQELWLARDSSTGCKSSEDAADSLRSWPWLPQPGRDKGLDTDDNEDGLSHSQS